MTLCALALALLLLGPASHRRAAERRINLLTLGTSSSWATGPRGLTSQSASAASRLSSGTEADKTGADPASAAQGRRLAWISAAAVAVACVACFQVHGLLVALPAGPAAFVATRRLGARTAGPDRRETESLPVLLELLATAIRSGAALSTALTSVAAVATGAPGVALARSAALLRLGAPPIEAWRPLRDHPQLGALAVVATRSADSGIRLADGLSRQAQTYRDELRAADAARATRVGVLALLPVGLCFLPAFVCLGIVPIVAGIAGTAFGGLNR